MKATNDGLVSLNYVHFFSRIFEIEILQKLEKSTNSTKAVYTTESFKKSFLFVMTTLSYPFIQENDERHYQSVSCK